MALARLRREGGETLVEVIVALAILATVLSSAFNVATLAYRDGTSSKERTEAINFAQQQAEMLRQYRDVAQQIPAAVGAPAYPVLGCTGVTDTASPPPTSCFYMAEGAFITAVLGELTDPTGRYKVGIAPVTTPASPYPGKLINYLITVHWEPAIASGGVENVAQLKLSLADHSSFNLRPCEDVRFVIPGPPPVANIDCSNLRP